jgi:hypothetical protein
MSSLGSIGSSASRASTATAQNSARGRAGKVQERANPRLITAAAPQNGNSWAGWNMSPWGAIHNAPPISSRALASSRRRVEKGAITAIASASCARGW